MTREPLQPIIRQYGRSWFSAYAPDGKYLAMGKTRREAIERTRHVPLA